MGISAMVAVTYAVECCVCDGNTQTYCNDANLNMTASSTSTGCTYCKKVKFSAGGNAVVTRSCESFCSSGSISLGWLTYINACCATELCNSASSLTSGFGLILGLASLLL